jgi:putative transposase
MKKKFKIKTMSEKYKIGDDEIPHFITFSVVNWIDALTRNDYKDIIVKSLQYYVAGKGLKLNAWVLMSNHVRLIAQCKQGLKLSDCLRDLKNILVKK